MSDKYGVYGRLYPQRSGVGAGNRIEITNSLAYLDQISTKIPKQDPPIRYVVSCLEASDVDRCRE